ncbi:MAG: TIGR02281 family clan AA aspartic protease [Candidatus Binatia bacterium]
MLKRGVLIIFLACSLPRAAGAADLFRWVDERGVIHFTDSLHNIPENHRTRAVRIQAREPPKAQEQPSPRAPEKVAVPIQQRGQIVIVAATVNEKTKGNFVVDTGASYTIISRATAQRLQIDLDAKHPTAALQTANGVIETPLVALDSVEVGGLQVKGITAAVHDVFPDSSISGLLGLNFLTNFRMDIDTKSSVLVLEKK